VIAVDAHRFNIIEYSQGRSPVSVAAAVADEEKYDSRDGD
jgi:hypothetical protein